MSEQQKPVKLDAARAGGEKLGIENLKIVIGFILFVAYELAAMIRSFSFTSALNLAFYIADNKGILDKGKQALLELKDLSVAEAEELTKFLGVNFDLANDSLEARIEAGLTFIPEGYGLLRQNIDYYSRVRDWIRGWGQTDEAAIRRLPARLKLAA